MHINLRPIGHIVSDYKKRSDIPRQSIDRPDAIARLVLDEEYADGLYGYRPGDYLVILSYFHKSEDTPMLIRPHSQEDPLVGVFKTRSPNRPNPIGMTIVEILEIDGSELVFKGVDMLDSTPVLDIKPYIEGLNPIK